MINKPRPERSGPSVSAVPSAADTPAADTPAIHATGQECLSRPVKEKESPDLLLEDDKHDRPDDCLHTGKLGNPPWSTPCTVVEADADCFNGSVNESDYPALKKRLEPVRVPSPHSRQSLYRDRFTGQFWLGVKARMSLSHWSNQIEVLKPLRTEVAEALFSVNISQGLVRLH